MKSTTSTVFTIVLLSVFSSASIAEARDKKAKIPESAPVTLTDRSESGRPAPRRMAVGISSSDVVTGSATSLAGILELDSQNLIHGYFSLPSTSPFQFSLAGLYKHNVAGSSSVGLHIGGGLGLGSTSEGVAAANAAAAAAAALGGVAAPATSDTAFFFQLMGVAGIHLPFPGVSNMMIHFDAGPALHIQSNLNDFGIGAFGSLLGASVFYYF
ncbi:MAG TPA: hypothetical protein VJB59_12610 [Bdellovibrionota bacterium]|nr:hypothetical protein [Bdellovibrionota bacterium]